MNQELKSKLLGSTRVSVGGVALLDRKAVEVVFGGTKPLQRSIGTSGPVASHRRSRSVRDVVAGLWPSVNWPSHE